MGTISVEKANNLFWLGRYAERTFTTLNEFHNYYDKMIDVDENIYKILCEKLMIPNIYTCKENFIKTYLFERNDDNSIYSNMLRAFDNAVVIRDEISTNSLSYIELALDKLEKSKESKMLLIDLQNVTDYLFAFWGSIDDNVKSEEARNIIKAGKYIERLDLYLRLSHCKYDINKEFSKLKNIISKVGFKHNDDSLNRIEDFINDNCIEEKKYEILNLLTCIFEV